MIEVRLFATLRAGREKVTFFSPNEIKDGYSVLEHLNIDEEEVAIFLVNGRHSELSTSLNEEDVVAIFPAVGGG